ncbi:magnesium-translocating P-type ATPase [Streptomyces sp. NPDC057963]|uniref:magnesium-translocating P-type ATPase n=1 Tax=Streptomyces sp. NPDC057963 TaxID=3346290 RepID=UPI0036E66914
MPGPAIASAPESGPIGDEAIRDRTAPTTLEALRRLDSGPRGLMEVQAEEYLSQFGENIPPDRWPGSWLGRFVRSLRDPFTAVLLCLALVSALVASWGTAGVIIVLVVVSCVLRSSGEHRAEGAMTTLQALAATTTTVLRRADEDAPPVAREIPVDQLVPGDVIRLGPGDLIPADVRLLRADGLSLYQAALTGESAPIAKYPVDAPPPVAGGIFEQPQLCFQGSSVAAGSGTAVVVATGARTALADRYEERGHREASAFDRSVHGISWILIRFMLITPPLVLMANAALFDRGLETLPFAVAVAVGLTPEMLPVIVTTCLARSASLLARSHGVIVKRLPALHDLGAVDVLCLDKTGTLTLDRPVVQRALDAQGKDASEVLHWASVNAWWTLQLADLPAPDAFDEAILEATDVDSVERYDGTAAIPFDSVRRLTTAVVRTPGRLGVHTLVAKGAVESVLERCVLEDRERERLLTLAAEQADSGLRVLAVATAERPARTRNYAPADERGLTFRGFVTLRDALVPTASDALKAFADRGITVKVLTGDHPVTAARACHDLGLAPGEVRTADDIEALTDAELTELARRTTVFARCTPQHKARITTALRAGGHTTGFLGDGINDVPALHAADVGICPRDAADVTRESADVVLADKDLTSIDHAITAGRYSSGNITTYLHTTLSSNLGNVIAMLTAGLLLPFLPMLPAQVLVQNLCFDAAQLAYAYDRPARNALRRPTVLCPRDFLRFITGFGVLNAAADLATFGVLTLALHAPGTAGDEAVFHSGWFTENLLTQALVMLLLRLGRRGAEGRVLGPVGRAAAVLAAAGLLLPLSPLAPLLGMAPLPGLYYLLLAAVLALYATALNVAGTLYERA